MTDPQYPLYGVVKELRCAGERTDGSLAALARPVEVRQRRPQPPQPPAIDALDGDALGRLKEEAARRLGLGGKVKEGGWGSLTAREAGRVGGLMTRLRHQAAEADCTLSEWLEATAAVEVDGQAAVDRD